MTNAQKIFEIESEIGAILIAEISSLLSRSISDMDMRISFSDLGLDSLALLNLTLTMENYIFRDLEDDEMVKLLSRSNIQDLEIAWASVASRGQHKK